MITYGSEKPMGLNIVLLCPRFWLKCRLDFMKTLILLDIVYACIFRYAVSSTLSRVTLDFGLDKIYSTSSKPAFFVRL